MKCPSCKLDIPNPDAFVCPGCDHVIDISAIGDEPRWEPISDFEDSTTVDAEALILGDLGGDDDESWEDPSPITGAGVRGDGLISSFVFYTSGGSRIVKPNAVPVPLHPAKTIPNTPLESFVLSCADGNRTIERIQRASGFSDKEMIVAVLTLVEKGLLRLLPGEDTLGASREPRTDPDGGPISREPRTDPDGGPISREPRTDPDRGPISRQPRTDPDGGPISRGLRTDPDGGPISKAPRSESGGTTESAKFAASNPPPLDPPPLDAAFLVEIASRPGEIVPHDSPQKITDRAGRAPPTLNIDSSSASPPPSHAPPPAVEAQRASSHPPASHTQRPARPPSIAGRPPVVERDRRQSVTGLPRDHAPPPFTELPSGSRGGGIGQPRQLSQRARKLLDQALKEKSAGNLVAAQMNLKLALTFDPASKELRRELSSLQRMKSVEASKSPKPAASPGRDAFEEASRAEATGDIDRAIELLEKALSHAQRPAYYNRLGVILATRKRDLVRGQQMIEKALELDPDNEIYKANLSKILTKAATADIRRRGGSGASLGERSSSRAGGLLGFFGKRK